MCVPCLCVASYFRLKRICLRSSLQGVETLNPKVVFGVVKGFCLWSGLGGAPSSVEIKLLHFGIEGWV